MTPLSRESAIHRIMGAPENQRPGIFREILPNIENENLAFELMPLVIGEAAGAMSIFYTLNSLILYKRKMQSDFAESLKSHPKYAEEFKWAHTRQVPDIADILDRTSFRDALVSITKLADIEIALLVKA